MRIKQSTLALAMSVAMSTGFVSSAAANVTNTDILNDQLTTDQVVTYGMGQQGQRYSPLSKINKETVQDVRPVWAFSFGGEKQRGQESDYQMALCLVVM